MDWQNGPIGMIRHDELLNTLLALWKTQHNTANRNLSAFAQGYEAGFEGGLDAVAQLVGLTQYFEEGKTSHHTKIEAKLGR